MRYKLVIKNDKWVYVKKKNLNKEKLLKEAEIISKKNPTWKLYVVPEQTHID
jgi:hypothetical protein